MISCLHLPVYSNLNEYRIVFIINCRPFCFSCACVGVGLHVHVFLKFKFDNFAQSNDLCCSDLVAWLVLMNVCVAFGLKK